MSASVSPAGKGAGQERPGAGWAPGIPHARARRLGRLPRQGAEDARARPRRRARPPRGAARVGRAPRRIPGRAAPPPRPWPRGWRLPASLRLSRAGGCGRSWTLRLQVCARRTWTQDCASRARRARLRSGAPASLPARAARGRAEPRSPQGRLRHRLGTTSAGKAKLFPLPKQKGSDWQDGAQLSPRALPPAAFPRLPRIAGFPGQCPSRPSPVPLAGEATPRPEDLGSPHSTGMLGLGAWSEAGAGVQF